MIITPVRSIENDVYSVVLKPDSFGTTSMTAEEEIAMLADTPQVLKYADIEFVGKFVVEDGTPVSSTDESAVEVKIALNNKEFKINEELEMSLSVDANKVLTSEIDETVLTDKYLVAQAKVILYETKVLAEIKRLLEVARAHVNTFEVTAEQTL